MADKTKNLRVGLSEVNLKNENKYQPAKLSSRERDGQIDANKMGKGHDFNTKAKVTSSGSSYHDATPGSGAGGNFGDKDASAAYLKERGKQGQSVSHYTGTTRHSREHTGYAGQTLYPSSPIDQVYNKADCCNDTPDPAEKKYK